MSKITLLSLILLLLAYLAGCQAVARNPETCGDGLLDPGEQCDDGQDNSDTEPDACRTNCRDPFCGDGVTDSGEQCDDGADNSATVPDACRPSCLDAYCGDDTIDTGEECDDGNFVDGDGCSTDCMVEIPPNCGDGNLDPDEECDDGVNNSDTQPDACRTNCKLPYCGDNIEDTGEGCDDGNNDDGDGCSADCVVEIPPNCGDGSLDPGEECDDGVNNSDTQPDACRTDCTLPACGDGVVDTADDCDDGDLDSGDGCDDSCLVEPGWICAGSPSVCVFDCTDGDGDLYGVGSGCLGPDCDDTDQNVNPGATEICNGVDDDCDTATDEQSDEACYDGPQGTEGVGQCRAGVRFCVDGVLGPCVGQVMPSAEACNLLDDNCEGQVDENTVTLTCGVGECANSTLSCVGGVLQQCVPGPAQPEVCGDSLDNDCNGLIDDGCGCIHVAPFGADSNPGSQASPRRTISAGIALASQSGQPKVVCVAAGWGCSWTFYNEDVVMADGVSVYGGYNPNTTPWTQQSLHASSNCVTEIRGQNPNGLVFDVTVTSPTILDNFALSLDPSVGPTSAVITVQGSTGAQISNCSVFGMANGTTTYGIQVLEDTSSGVPVAATPLIVSTTAEGGAGTTAAAIYSYRSSPTIQTSCDPGNITPEGRCLLGCITGIHIRGNRFYGAGSQFPDFAYGVLLEDSPGATVDQSVVCASGNDESVAIKVIGDATGTVISRNDVTVWRGLLDYGVLVEDCAGAAPWIGDNERLGAEGNPAGTATVAAVRAIGDCHPLIESNVLIVGGIEGQTNETRGVHCSAGSGGGVASQCVVVGNREIRASNNNFPASSIGVLCEDGSCGVISNNDLIHGNAGVNVVGIQFNGPTNAFVDSNRIEGGCGVSFAAAIFSQDGAARVQNNSIYGGSCVNSSVLGDKFFGIFVLTAQGVNEVDIHSNMIHGGGSGQNCESRAVTFDLVGGVPPPAGPLGVLRNNIIEAGDCPVRYALEERDPGADPRIVENNDFLWPQTATALYLDESSTPLYSAAEINALGDTSASGNIDQDPLWVMQPSGFANLTASSPCRNAGTASVAPAWDFEGTPRPQENAPDIGPDEFEN